VRFGIGALQLELGTERKDVVQDAVFLTEVLEEATCLGVMHKVPLEDDAG